MIRSELLSQVTTLLVLLFLGSVTFSQNDDISPNLSDSIRYQDEMGGTLTVFYPETWVVRTSVEGLDFADSNENLLRSEGEPNSGGFQLNVVSVDIIGLQGFLKSDDKPTLEEAVDLLIQMVNNAQDNNTDSTIKMGPTLEIETGGKTAARAAGTLTLDKTTTDMLFMVFEEGPVYVAMTLLAANGEAGQYVDTLNTMVEAITYARDEATDLLDLELMETIAFENSNGSTLIVNYPDSWVTRVSGDELTFADSNTTLDNNENILGPGQFQLTIFALPRIALRTFDLPLTSDAGDVVDSVKTLLFESENSDFADLSLTFGAVNFQRRTRSSSANVIGIDENESLEIMLAAIEKRNLYFVVILAAPHGETMNYRDILGKIIDSAEYVPGN